MRIRILILLIILFTALPAPSAAGDRVPLYYVKGTGDISSERDVDYPVFDISPSLGTVLIDNGDYLVWAEGVQVIPGKGGAVLALLEGTAPEAEWALMGGGAIPYRRNGGHAWFARAAFEADVESFFPGDEVIGLIEKHKIAKDGRISPEAQSYITVIDDDFIGEICSGVPYDTYESARGYDEVSLNLLEGPGDTLLIIEDISCQFRVSSYDWRRSGIGDFFRYRDGELRREGYTISAVGVGIDSIIGGVTSDFSFNENGRLFQWRTAYIEITARSERLEVTSGPLEFTANRGEIKRKKRQYRDMIEGITRGDLKLYKLPDGKIPPIDTIPSETPLDLLIYFPLQSEENGNWYLVESKDVIDGRKHIGWALSSDFNLLK